MTAQSRLWWLPFGKVPEISPGDLQSKIQAGQDLQVLDVRTALEWRASRIEGAVSVPLISLRSRWADLNLDMERFTVAICLSAHRSIPAVRMLRDAGFSDIHQLQGGMRAWWQAGFPTVSGR